MDTQSLPDVFWPWGFTLQMIVENFKWLIGKNSIPSHLNPLPSYNCTYKLETAQEGITKSVIYSDPQTNIKSEQKTDNAFQYGAHF